MRVFILSVVVVCAAPGLSRPLRCFPKFRQPLLQILSSRNAVPYGVKIVAGRFNDTDAVFLCQYFYVLPQTRFPRFPNTLPRFLFRLQAFCVSSGARFLLRLSPWCIPSFAPCAASLAVLPARAAHCTLGASVVFPLHTLTAFTRVITKATHCCLAAALIAGLAALW